MKTIAYLRVSTGQQSVESQRLAILEFARTHSITVDQFIEVSVSSTKDRKRRRILELLEELEPGDCLIVSELSRLGRSISEIVRLVDRFKDKQVELVCIKEAIRLPADGKQDLTTTVQLSMFSLLAEVERRLISERTREGLKRAKANGKRLGRKPGSYSSKIDRHRTQIEEMLRMGIPKKRIAESLDICYSSFLGWISRRNIDCKPDMVTMSGWKAVA